MTGTCVSILHKWKFNDSNIKRKLLGIKDCIVPVRLVTNLYFLVKVIFVTYFSLSLPLTQQLMLRK
jgi:hypothetical protein